MSVILAPYALFGLAGLDTVSHSMLWSMLVNIGLFVCLSLAARPDPAEHFQAAQRPGLDAFAEQRG